VEKYQVIGLVVLVVVTFFMINSDQVFAVSTYKNSTGTTCSGNFNFTCPLDLSSLTGSSTFPKNLAGVGTDNGYFSIWQQNFTASDLRLFYASTTDGITGTTPLDISGSVMIPTVGINENQLHIFEVGGTIDLFWLEVSISLLDQSSSELNHARSTNGGTSFTASLVNSDIDFFFPTVNGNTIGLAMHDAGQDRMLFRNSTDGGATFGANIFLDGGADECNVPRFPVKMVKDGSTIHASWFATFAGNATSALCYNQSTDSGANWSTTAQILSDTIPNINVDRKPCIEPSQTEARCELQIFISGTKVAITYENQANDSIMQARSTNSGVSFGQATIALDTVTIGQDEGCTDPSPVARTWANGDRIYISCTGSAGWGIKNSTDFGLTYSLVQNTSDDASGGRFDLADDPLGFATPTSTSVGVFAVSEDTTPSRMQFLFSSDAGLTYDNSTTMFMTSDSPRALTGNVTDIWLGFQHTQDGFSNAWVSTFATGLSPPAPSDTTPPVITITGDNPLEHLIDTTYTDAGAVCNDAVDGSLAVVTDLTNVNTAVLGSFTVTYTCTDLSANQAQAVRTVNVVEQISTTTTTGGAVGAPVSGTVDTGIEGFTPEQQLAFDQAVEDAIASIEPSEGNIVETLLQTFFEFIVIDKTHEELQLQSFLDDQRLGFRWSTGDDLVIVSATPALSPFMFTFEQFPVVKQGSGAFVSTNFILYNLEVPRLECSDTISVNCVEKIRYEIPVTVNAVINGTQVSDTGTITVDLTEDEIDPILLIILSLFAIPVIGVIIQRSRGRSTVEPLKRVIS